MTREGVTYYLTYDQVGSLRAVADGAGNVIKTMEYDAFGNVVGDSNAGFLIPFGFAGGLHDRDTGLVRFGYRDYDSETGRWTAKDPIGFEGGDTDLYGYALNNPINRIDPDGLMSIFKPIKDAKKTGDLIQRLHKLEDEAWKNKDAVRATTINSIIKDLQKRNLHEIMEILKNAPPGTSISGTPISSKPEIIKEIYDEMKYFLDEYEKGENCEINP
jgi:RHS repeat-associated protein